MPDNDETTPLATVVIPAFNHELYVEEAIRSVFAQTYPNVELIVVDDCSTDATVSIIERLRAERDFTFLRNERNSGINTSLIKGFAAAQGVYLSVIASDDMLVPDKIERQVRYLQKHDLDGVYASGYKLFSDGSRELIDTKLIERKFRDGSILEHVYIDDTSGPLFQSGLFSRNAVDEVLPLRQDFKSDDHMFLIKVLEKFKVGFISDPLFIYRIHSGNTYKKYWYTLPIRVEIIARLSPERLRPRGIANIFYSHAQYLYLDGHRTAAIKFMLASIILWPSPRRTAAILVQSVKGVSKYLFKPQKAAE